MLDWLVDRLTKGRLSDMEQELAVAKSNYEFRTRQHNEVLGSLTKALRENEKLKIQLRQASKAKVEAVGKVEALEQLVGELEYRLKEDN